MDTARERRIPLLAAIGIEFVALTGCTGGAAPDPAPSSTSVAPTGAAPIPDASASLDAALEVDRAALPISEERITDWADTAVGAQDGATGAVFRGWISRTNGPSFVTEYSTLEPGAYEIAFACRGDSTLTVEYTTSDLTPVGTATCSDSTVITSATTPSAGLRAQLRLDDDGAPTVWASSFRATPEL